MSTADGAPRPTRRGWVGLAVSLPSLRYSMDLTVLHLAVPNISEDLRPSSAQLLGPHDQRVPVARRRAAPGLPRKAR